MTNKEIAGRLREIVEKPRELDFEYITALADELDPPLPEPGTVVWWRDWADMPWKIGFASPEGVYRYSSTNSMIFEAWDDIEWKPARILADDEVAVKVPPVSEWPERGEYLDVFITGYKASPWYVNRLITRAEAGAREAGR